MTKAVRTKKLFVRLPIVVESIDRRLCSWSHVRTEDLNQDPSGCPAFQPDNADDGSDGPFCGAFGKLLEPVDPAAERSDNLTALFKRCPACLAAELPK